MNAFDAVAAGAGDTGLASLLATTTTTTTPANAPGVTHFAQLLDQLNTLPVPQAGTMQPPPSVARPEGLTPIAPTLPVQQSSGTISPFVPDLPQVDRAAVRPAALDCGLRLPATGKIMPAIASSGTILPASSTADALPVEKTDTVATLPIADRAGDPAGSIPVDALPLVSAQLVATALRPVVAAPPAAFAAPPAAFAAPPAAAAAPAAPVRSAATVRVEPSVAGAVVPPAVAAGTAPTPPAVTLMAADVPVVAASEGTPAPERGTREPAFAEALPRPMPQVAADLSGTGAVEMPVTAPLVRAEPQQPAMQDLTRIVERLAAAREAAAPAATQLAVDHAEFGPLSLSIRQGDRGELAIAVAAADPESQVALVAAIAQGEAPGFEQTPDRRGSESAAREQALASQHGESRGQGGQRDRLAGQQQHRQPAPQRGPAPERDGETRNGTYA